MRTAQKVSSAAQKILLSQTASKAAKSVAASVLTQTKTSREAKSAAASAQQIKTNTLLYMSDEAAADLDYLHKEWPWPTTRADIVERLLFEEAKKMRTIQRAVAEHFEKKKGKGK